jgi:hypothetical protein
LCRPTGALPTPDADPPLDDRGERTAMMPKRRRTRAQHIATERRQNRTAREARRKECEPWHFGPGDAVGDGELPPF